MFYKADVGFFIIETIFSIFIKCNLKYLFKLENQKVENDSKYANELKDKLEEIIAKIKQFEQINEETLANKEKLFRLYFSGVIDSDGKLKRDK